MRFVGLGGKPRDRARSQGSGHWGHWIGPQVRCRRCSWFYPHRAKACVCCTRGGICWPCRLAHSAIPGTVRVASVRCRRRVSPDPLLDIPVINDGPLRSTRLAYHFVHYSLRALRILVYADEGPVANSRARWLDDQAMQRTTWPTLDGWAGEVPVQQQQLGNRARKRWHILEWHEWTARTMYED